MDKNDHFESREITGLNAVFDELETHCHSRAIITITGSSGESFRFDMERTTNGIEYADDLGESMLVRTRFLRLAAESGGAAVTVRSFTDKNHHRTGLPYKELRGYLLREHEGRLECNQLAAESVREAFTTDATTGEPIDPEIEAIYCGPNTCIMEDSA